jgi:excisionase family DNA binding protein
MTESPYVQLCGSLEHAVETIFPELLTRREVAHVMRISDRTLRNWIAEGRIAEFRIRGTSRFQKSAVLQLIADGMTGRED